MSKSVPFKRLSQNVTRGGQHSLRECWGFARDAFTLCRGESQSSRKNLPQKFGGGKFKQLLYFTARGGKIHIKISPELLPERGGADYEARTRYLHLGKVALYRMS